MIHLDAYEFDGKTFIRTWDTNNPDSLMESVERPHVEEPSIEKIWRDYDATRRKFWNGWIR